VHIHTHARAQIHTHTHIHAHTHKHTNARAHRNHNGWRDSLPCSHLPINAHHVAHTQPHALYPCAYTHILIAKYSISLSHTHTCVPITAITVGLILFLGLICPLVLIVWPIYAYIFVPHYLKVSPTNHAEYQKNLIGTYVCVCEREIECLAMSIWVYGVATISRLLKIIRLFGEYRSLL